MADFGKTKQFVDTFWEDEIVPAITEYIRIPNVSPMFDSDWQAHGAHGPRARAREELGRSSSAGRLDASRGTPQKPHAAFASRGSRKIRRHDFDVRASRQTARDDRMAR